MYRRVIYPLFQHADAEHSHELVLRLLAAPEKRSAVRRLLQRLLAYDDPRLRTELAGLEFPNPFGVAAGLDKNAVAVQTWGALGFGHVEVGTVTPQPQPGNERPRVFRLPADRALINRMGFPSQGMAAVVARLQQLGNDRPVVGVNVGANKTSVEAGRAVEDYVSVIDQLYQYADYLVLNISSPNTAHLRELQGKAALQELVQQVVARRDALAAEHATVKPLLLKIAPDLAPQELYDVVAICFDYRVDGVVATNTTVARPSDLRSPARSETGGLSGLPLRERSTEVIRALFEHSGGKLPIIGVGGVFGVADVWAKLAAGARLVQLYTGLVYEGPALAYRLNRSLVRTMQRHGFNSIDEIVGCGAAIGSSRSVI